VESYLTLLEEKGGKEGQVLVQAFREADTVTRCGRGGCHEMKDQITITIKQGGSGGQYAGSIFGGKSFELGSEMFKSSSEKEKLLKAGQFGHEIVHLNQDVEGTGPGSLYNEIEAYDVQSKIYKRMGLTKEDYSLVGDVERIASYKNASEKEIMNSPWANNEYRSFPLTNRSIRFFDDLKYNGLKYRWRRLLNLVK
jgi:hypothetical protein